MNATLLDVDLTYYAILLDVARRYGKGPLEHISSSQYQVWRDGRNYYKVRLASALSYSDPVSREHQLWVDLKIADALLDSDILVTKRAGDRMPHTARAIVRSSQWMKALHDQDIEGFPYLTHLDWARITECKVRERLAACAVSQEIKDYLWAVFESLEFPDPEAISVVHGDAHLGNWVGKRSPVMVDWEAAGLSHPEFDLASMVHSFHWHDRQDLIPLMLESYGNYDECLLCLYLRIKTVLYLCWTALMRGEKTVVREMKRFAPLLSDPHAYMKNSMTF